MNTRSGQIRLPVALVLLAVLAGCVGLPEGAESDIETRISNVARVDLSETIVRHGISLALPPGVVVSDGFSGDVGAVHAPIGVVARFTGFAGRLVGVVQLIPLTDAARVVGEPFLPSYLSTYDVVDGEPVFVTLPAATAAEVAHGPALEFPEGDLIVAFFRLPPAVSETHGVLVEVWHTVDLLPDAVSIVEAMRVAADADDIPRSERLRRLPNGDSRLSFVDPSGAWSWVADTDHGFLVRRRADAHDLYVALDLWDVGTVPTPDGIEGDGATDGQAPARTLSVEISHGQWRWAVPLVPRFERDRRRWTGRVPSVEDGQDIRIDVIEPGRAYRNGQPRVAELPDLSAIAPVVQALFDHAVTIE